MTQKKSLGLKAGIALASFITITTSFFSLNQVQVNAQAEPTGTFFIQYVTQNGSYNEVFCKDGQNIPTDQYVTTYAGTQNIEVYYYDFTDPNQTSDCGILNPDLDQFLDSATMTVSYSPNDTGLGNELITYDPVNASLQVFSAVPLHPYCVLGDIVVGETYYCNFPVENLPDVTLNDTEFMNSFEILGNYSRYNVCWKLYKS